MCCGKPSRNGDAAVQVNLNLALAESTVPLAVPGQQRDVVVCESRIAAFERLTERLDIAIEVEFATMDIESANEAIAIAATLDEAVSGRHLISYQLVCEMYAELRV